jgi:hypothetical protein
MLDLDFIPKNIIEQQKNNKMTQFNPSDKITVDVPLFIRLLEYAREDAKTDMDLHNVAEKAVAASETGKTLTMTDYDNLVEDNSEDQQMDEVKRMIKLANIKTFFQ